MALLHDIQEALLDDKIGVGSVLLKLRVLASKLDADILEEWVHHETEGYPTDAWIPDYRIAQITYTGTFTDIAKQINNVSIPSHLIEKFAGKKWVTYEIRDGLPFIDSRLENNGKDGNFAIDSSNLKLILQDKIYVGMAIVEISNRIDTGAFTRIQHAVRAKTLDFALKLEKQVPAAAEISVGQTGGAITPTEQENVKNLTQQIFYGDVTNIHADYGSSVTLNVTKGDTSSLAKALEAAGFPSDEAKELAEIAGKEASQDEMKPLGTNVQEWLKDKLKGGAVDAWGIGKSVARELVIEALKQFYGLK
ncbi:MAG: hypothetical protein OXC26_08055 [Albidovulum sp.]|nr:hypothetical protein [Albidovulum sp.]